MKQDKSLLSARPNPTSDKPLSLSLCASAIRIAASQPWIPTGKQSVAISQTVAADADGGLFKSNEIALRLRVQVPVLRVFGSERIWLTTPELFVATQRRYVLRVFPLFASGVSQSF